MVTTSHKQAACPCLDSESGGKPWHVGGTEDVDAPSLEMLKAVDGALGRLSWWVGCEVPSDLTMVL